MILRPEAVQAYQRRAVELAQVRTRAAQVLAPIVSSLRPGDDIARGEIQAALIQAVLDVLRETEQEN